MLIKILGAIDLLAGVSFILANNFEFLNKLIPDPVIITLAILLLIKGIIFLLFLDFASVIDVISAIIILISISIHIPTILALIVFILLIQKAIFSFIS